MVEIECPNCHSRFDTEEEYRGAFAECGDCGATFQIPQEGSMGVLPGAEIAVICPGCKTEHQVFEDSRGLTVECCFCETLFQIPEVGGLGERIEPEPPAAAKQGDAGPGGVPEDDVAPITPRNEHKVSTQTIRLNRKSILDNTMQQHKKPGGEAPPSPAPKPPGAPGRLAAARRKKKKKAVQEPTRVSAAAAGTAKKTGSSRPEPPAKPPRPGPAPAAAGTKAEKTEIESPEDALVDTAPDWAQRAIRRGEKMHGYAETKAAMAPLALVLTLVAAVMAPLAAFVPGDSMPLKAAISVAALVLWGLALFLGTQFTGVVVTSKRVVLIAGKKRTSAPLAGDAE